VSALGAVLLVEDAGPAPELVELIGAERGEALQTALTARATSWARDLPAGSFRTATGAAALPARIDSILAAVTGPLVVVWPRLPRFRPEHADGLVGDLVAGCDLVFGPIVDGGFYLLGLSAPAPNVLALLQEGFETTPGTPGALAAAAESGLEIGYLRPERGLRGRDDLEAALADPLTPPEIRRLLSG
jgi:hypothetical protein